MGQRLAGVVGCRAEVGLEAVEAAEIAVDHACDGAAGLAAAQADVRTVTVAPEVLGYAVDLARATRQSPSVRLGVSPRGSLMLFRSAQAAAFVDGREFVLPDDIQRLAPHVLAHRVVLTSKARYGNQTQAKVLEDILHHVPVPT